MFDFFATSFFIALVIWGVQFLIYKMRALYRFNDIYPQRSLCGAETDPKRLLEKIQRLYLAKLITNLYLEEDYISFEDRSIFPQHNIYYIRFAKPDSLYYRGSFHKYRFNRNRLESVVAYLSSR
jgi:hypothetical protein